MSEEMAWIEAARAGDTQAYGHVVAAYERQVFGLAFRMLGNAEEAEDAAQEAFLKSYRALGSYDPRRAFSTWLLSITAHHCIDRIRRRRLKEVSLDGLPAWRAVAGDAPDPERQALASDRRDRIGALLEGLPELDRLVIVLRYWNDLGYEEIAEATGHSVSSVKSRLHRARRRMADLVIEDAKRQPPGARPQSERKAASAAAPSPPQGVMACTVPMLAA